MTEKEILKYIENKIPTKVVKSYPRFFVASVDVYKTLSDVLGDGYRLPNQVLEYQGIHIYPEEEIVFLKDLS